MAVGRRGERVHHRLGKATSCKLASCGHQGKQWPRDTEKQLQGPGVLWLLANLNPADKSEEEKIWSKFCGYWEVEPRDAGNNCNHDQLQRTHVLHKGSHLRLACGQSHQGFCSESTQNSSRELHKGLDWFAFLIFKKHWQERLHRPRHLLRGHPRQLQKELQKDPGWLS